MHLILPLGFLGEGVQRRKLGIEAGIGIGYHRLNNISWRRFDVSSHCLRVNLFDLLEIADPGVEHLANPQVRYLFEIFFMTTEQLSGNSPLDAVLLEEVIKKIIILAQLIPIKF